MEVLNLENLPDEAKREVKALYLKLKRKYIDRNFKAKTHKKLPSGFYNPIEIESYDLIASRDEIYER